MGPISQALIAVGLTAAITGLNALAYVASGIALGLELALAWASTQDFE
jgi:hypothetical protein